jgi:hypothetical protein
VEAALPHGETLAAAPSGHREKRACEAELRAFMVDHPGAEVLDLTNKGAAG